MEQAKEKLDWRIGLTCRPKFHGHDLYYERGKIIDVQPSGTANLFDKDGVLKIEMESGAVFWNRASDWVTG